MKSSLAFYIGAASAAALLSGCGQPGPLYLPKVPPKPTATSPAATDPVAVPVPPFASQQ